MLFGNLLHSSLAGILHLCLVTDPRFFATFVTKYNYSNIMLCAGGGGVLSQIALVTFRPKNMPKYFVLSILCNLFESSTDGQCWDFN